MNRLLTLVLLVAVAVPTAADDALDGVVVTYFHRTLRCQTCLQLESLAEFAVTQELAEEVAAGDVTWRTIDYQLGENARHAEIFALEAPSLIVARYAAGELVEWRNLERMWELSEDTDAFDAYVVANVREYLQAPPAEHPVNE